jgi:peptide subunit release factor 1 (eRF1)
MPLAAQALMPKTSLHLDTPLRERLQQLAAFEPSDLPVVSLYLNLTPDQHGRDHYDAFCRKAFADRLRSFDADSARRQSLERDLERIRIYLAQELNPSSNGLVLFSCAGAGGFFEAIQLDVPVSDHWLFVDATPHIYPLVRLIDQYPRYAAVLLDTNRAQICVFGLGIVEREQQVSSVKTRRSAVGGWSQARYQRHADNFHLHHIKEVVDTLDRIIRADGIQHIVVSGNDAAVPLLKSQLPSHLAEKVVDVLRLNRTAGEDEILDATLQALRQHDAQTDVERVAEAIDSWRAGGLGVAGPEATLHALQLGQVDELLITAAPQALKSVQSMPEGGAVRLGATVTSAANRGTDTQVQLSDELVTRAERTGARVRMIEDPALLRNVGGVAALLRFRI